MKDDGNYRVKLGEHQLWWLKNSDGTGALAYPSHCDSEGNVIVLADSYAHVCNGGVIRRYGKNIGTVDDLEFLK